jgi:hypothetical protein
LGKPVNIIQPSAVVTKCIKAFWWDLMMKY